MNNLIQIVGDSCQTTQSMVVIIETNTRWRLCRSCALYRGRRTACTSKKNWEGGPVNC